MKELIEKIGKGTRKKTVKVLAGIVAFATAYSLILPAITIDEETAQEEPGMVLNESENTEEVLAEYEAPEEVVEQAPAEAPEAEEAPAEEVKEETPAEETDVEEISETVEETVTEETKPAEAARQEEESAETPTELPAVAGKLEYETEEDYKITAEYTEEAGLTEKAELEVKETLKEDEYTNLLVKAQKEFEDDIAQARFFEVKFLDNDNEKKAEGKVTVTYIPYKAFELDDTQELTVITLDKEDKFHEIDEKKIEFKVTDKKTEEIKFETEEFDDFAVIVTENIPVGYPAKEFAGKAGDVTVRVSAPEGAFPEGTTMTVTAVAEDKVIDQVNDAVEYRVGKVRAVDITFKDKDGKEIEPMKQIKVSMTSDLIKAADTAEIVHIDDEGKGSVVEQSSDKSAADEVIFESKDFSIYVIAETIITNVITADGETYEISVTYNPEAGIPEGATLYAEEITDEETYNTYMKKTEEAVISENGENNILSARFFDIEIRNGEEVIEPTQDVKITITYKGGSVSLGSDDTISAIHFGKEGTELKELTPETSTEEITEVIFEQGSFSVTGTVITNGTLSNGNYIILHNANGSYYALGNDGSRVAVTVSESDEGETIVTLAQNDGNANAQRNIIWTRTGQRWRGNQNTGNYLNPGYGRVVNGNAVNLTITNSTFNVNSNNHNKTYRFANSNYYLRYNNNNFTSGTDNSNSNSKQFCG